MWLEFSVNVMTVLGQSKGQLEAMNPCYKPLYPTTTDSEDGNRRRDCRGTQDTVESQGRRPRNRGLGLAKVRNRSGKRCCVWNIFVALISYVLHT